MEKQIMSSSICQFAFRVELFFVSVTLQVQLPLLVANYTVRTQTFRGGILDQGVGCCFCIKKFSGKLPSYFLVENLSALRASHGQIGLVRLASDHGQR